MRFQAYSMKTKKACNSYAVLRLFLESLYFCGIMALPILVAQWASSDRQFSCHGHPAKQISFLIWERQMKISLPKNGNKHHHLAFWNREAGERSQEIFMVSQPEVWNPIQRSVRTRVGDFRLNQQGVWGSLLLWQWLSSVEDLYQIKASQGSTLTFCSNVKTQRGASGDSHALRQTSCVWLALHNLQSL